MSVYTFLLTGLNSLNSDVEQLGRECFMGTKDEDVTGEWKKLHRRGAL
jgi:hypothetical protein